MQDTNHLLIEADKNFDQGNYEEACHDYQKALESGQLDKHQFSTALANFQDSLNMLWLALLRKLQKQYPDSIAVNLGMARYFVNSSSSQGRAIEIYSHLLAQCPDSLPLRGILYSGRINAAIKTQQYKTLLDDLIDLWKLMDEEKAHPKAKRDFLKRLAAIDDPQTISIFESLSANKLFPASIQKFFRAKVQELELLVTATDELLMTISP